MVKVEAWGAGGGGGSPSGRAGGGGGGAYASSTFEVLAGSYTITVGTGGGVGVAGGPSSFNSLVIAAGGGSSSSSSTSGAGGSIAASTGDTEFAGGTGGIPGSGTNGGGGGGGSATSSADGTNGGASVSGAGGPGGTGEGNGGVGASTSGSNPAVAGSAPGGGGGGRASTTNITSASGASGRVIVTVLSVLPIKIISFTGSVKNKEILLSFSTATETNNSHFVIERGADTRTFSEIGQVRGAGTTQEQHDYTFTDERPLKGTNYYRLRQVDYDGTESFSPVVSVVFGKSERITLAPSPATDRVRIRLDEALSGDAQWQVYDNTGRQVLSGAWEAETADYELDVNTLPEGMYTFRLVVGASVQVKQFRKM